MSREKNKKKNIDLLFNTIGLPVQSIVGPAIKHAPPQVKLVIVIFMIISILTSLIFFGVGFSQLGSVGELPTKSNIGKKTVLPNGSVMLEVPYFNQFLDKLGNINPKSGWKMCGAASAVMVLGFQKKLTYITSEDLKRYMYQDKGQNLPVFCNGLEGAFSITAKGYCDRSSMAGLRDYLAIYKSKTKDIAINFNNIKNAIDRGNPVILSTSFPWDHVFVAKGYTLDGRIIVNDSFKDHQDNTWNGSPNPINYSFNGESAIYELNYKPANSNQSVIWVGAMEIY